MKQLIKEEKLNYFTTKMHHSVDIEKRGEMGLSIDCQEHFFELKQKVCEHSNLNFNDCMMKTITFKLISGACGSFNS